MIAHYSNLNMPTVASLTFFCMDVLLSFGAGGASATKTLSYDVLVMHIAIVIHILTDGPFCPVRLFAQCLHGRWGGDLKISSVMAYLLSNVWLHRHTPEDEQVEIKKKPTAQPNPKGHFEQKE